MKQRRLRLIILVFLVIVGAAAWLFIRYMLAAGVNVHEVQLYQENMPADHIVDEEIEEAEEIEEVAEEIEEEAYRIPPYLSINSPNAVLVDFETGEILFYRGASERVYPASMVKMMTALVAIEHIGDRFDEKVALREEMFPPIVAANAAVAGFLPGESVRAVDLLYGVLLPSGADSSIGLAEHLAGSESAFVELMNSKAREIGMGGTNFANSTGLHDENQYSTVIDMAALLRYALEDDTFRRIIASRRHSTAATSLRDGITFNSTLFSGMDSPEFDGGVILGGRTGWTSMAGQCLASFAVVGGRKYILVTAGAMREYHGQRLHIDDAFIIYGALFTR